MSANKEVKLVVSAENRASNVIKEVGAAIVAAFSAREIIEFGKAAVEAASAQESAETKLATALGRRSQALLDQAEAMRQRTKYDDDVVTSAQAQVAAFTKNEDAIKRVTAAAADFAAAKGMDLVSASEVITKSVYGQVNMLGRYGIELNGAQGSAERLASAMQKLNDHFGGQAVAQAGTFAGQIVILHNSWNNLQKSIGTIIVQNPAVMAGMGLLKQLFEDMGRAVQGNNVYLMKLVQEGLAGLVKGVGVAVNVVFSFQYALHFVETVFNGLMYAILTGLDLLVSPFSYVLDQLEKIGMIAVNPLKGVSDTISLYRAGAHSALEQSSKDMDDTGVKMAIVSQRASAMADTISNIQIPAIKAATEAIKGKGDAHELTAKQIATQMAQEVEYQKNLAALYKGYGATKPEMQQRDLSVYDAETSAKIAAMKAQDATAEAIYQAEAMRAMGRQALVMQQEQDNETLMESISRMAQTYDQAGAIMEGRQDVLNRIKQAGTNIHLAADKAMETQLLRLVETHKFSVAAIGQALMQSVKMELLAVAAKAAVQALYFTALGIAGSTPWGAATIGPASIWFKAAAEMAAVAGMAIAGAAAVNAIAGPGAQQAEQGSNPSNPTYTSNVPAPQSAAAAQQAPQRQIVNNYHFYGDILDKDTFARDMLPRISKAAADGVA